MGKLMTYPKQKEPEDIWQRRATAAGILAVRELINGGTAFSPATPVGRLDDIEIGWLIAAGIFGWIKCRSEQAIAEGWNIEATIHVTGLDPDPWDAGVVESILPELGELHGVDWHRQISAWPKAMMVRFLIEAMKLINVATIARDAGGGIATTSSQSKEVLQRTAAAEAGGPLMTPEERDDPI
jgi:hypothetical protein